MPTRQASAFTGGAPGGQSGDPRPTFFISDLHLTPDRPLPVQLFQRFIQDIAPQGAALYVLGDFFEAWVGDDDLAQAFHQHVAQQLKQLVEAGVPVYFIAGNRDFLAGEALAAATGWRSLTDPTVIDLHGVPTLISHGDAYCIDDQAYQAFRRQVRDPGWQAAFLQKPLSERHQIAESIRAQSEQAKAGKHAEIMDVNDEAIRTAMHQAGVLRMIHGHTHRPARHTLQINDKACERWVLADWYDSGSYLACDETGCRAVGFT